MIPYRCTLEHDICIVSAAFCGVLRHRSVEYTGDGKLCMGLWIDISPHLPERGTLGENN